MKTGICICLALAVVAVALAAQDNATANTEEALVGGIKPIKSVVICPPVFDGAFGGKLPLQSQLTDIVEQKLKSAGIPYKVNDKHEETVVDRRIADLRRTTGWMHVKVQVLNLPDRKVVACRITVQIQSPVTHPADAKRYVFANLYEDSKLIIAADELAGQAIENGMSELFGVLTDRWARAHK